MMHMERKQFVWLDNNNTNKAFQLYIRINPSEQKTRDDRIKPQISEIRERHPESSRAGLIDPMTETIMRVK